MPVLTQITRVGAAALQSSTTATETGFYELVELATESAASPLGCFELVSERGTHLRVTIGWPAMTPAASGAICEEALKQPGETLAVQDTALHPLFGQLEALRAAPALRSFAAMPLYSPEGEPLGVLIVADTVPRTLTHAQLRSLKALANQLKIGLDLRVQQGRLREALRAKDSLLEELYGSEMRFRTFMNNCPFVSFIKDREGRFVFYNKRLAEHFSIGTEEWIGKADAEIWPAEIAYQFAHNDQEVLNGGVLVERLEETRSAQGVVNHWRSYKFPWRNEDGQMLLVAFAVDVTEENARRCQLEEANRQLEKLATSDGLTGLANRRVLDERVEFEFRFARRHKTPLSVILLDLDNFKQRNDEYGHAAGDDVLRRLGELVIGTLRSTDLAARYGGEEFVILLPGAETEGAQLFIGRLLQAMQGEPWPHLPVTASFGVSNMGDTVRSGRRLIELADDAMYAAKRGGKNRTVTQRELLEQTLEQLKTETGEPEASLAAARGLIAGPGFSAEPDADPAERSPAAGG